MLYVLYMYHVLVRLSSRIFHQVYAYNNYDYQFPSCAVAVELVVVLMLPRLELVVVGVVLAQRPAVSLVTRPTVGTPWPTMMKTRRRIVQEGMVGINWKTVLKSNSSIYVVH